MKHFVFGLLVVGALVLNSTFETIIHPTVVDSFAVQQLEDSDVSANVMRAYDRLANNVPLCSWGLVLVAGVLLYRKDVVSAVKSFGEKEV